MRDPGAQHRVGHPARDQLVDQPGGQRGRRGGVLRGGRSHGRRSCRTASTSAIRCRQCSTRSGEAASASSLPASTAGRRTASAPSTGQQRVGHHVAGQQLHRREAAGVRQLGQRRGEGDPCRDADARLHRARDDDGQADVLGDPQAGADAAERLHLEYGDVGRLEVAHAIGVGRAADRLVGGDRHGHPTAYDGQVLDRGDRLLDVLQPTGRPRPVRRCAATASSTDQPPLASMRTSPSAPSASRTASSRASSSPGSCPGSATLTLAVRQPAEASTISRARSGSHAGHGDVDRDPVADRVGPAEVGGLAGAVQPGRRGGGVVLEERAELPPARRALRPARPRGR